MITRPRHRRLPARRQLPLLLAGAALLAGCVGAPAPLPSPAPPPRSSAPPEPADPARRAQVRLELATLYFGRGQAEVALDEVRQALEARPDLAEAHGLRGLILASLGQTQAAEASLLRAVALSPQDGGALHNHGWFLCQQRRFDEADARFEATLVLPTYRDVQRTLLAQGVCQARAGRTAAAEQTLARSFELDPSNPTTAFNLAELLLKRGDAERARFYVRRIHTVPAFVNAQSLWLLARIEHRLGRPDEVGDIGRQLQARFSQSPEAALFEQGRFDD